MAKNHVTVFVQIIVEVVCFLDDDLYSCTHHMSCTCMKCWIYLLHVSDFCVYLH